jgi:uncharacterized protein YjbI with pentapeptide repeats
MRNNDVDDVQLRDVDLNALKHVDSMPDEQSFIDLVRSSGLDPAVDLQFAGLQGVNLTDSDLRGVNLQGADLRGCYGTSIVCDHTTNLLGATTSGSVLAHFAASQDFFRENPRWQKKLDSLKTQSWDSVSIWASDNVVPENLDKNAAIRVAQELFSTSDSRVVRHQILLCAKGTFEESKDYMDFLLRICAAYDTEQAHLVDVATQLAKHYANERVVLDTILQLFRSDNAKVRAAVLPGILRSQIYPIIKALVVAAMTDEPDADVRRLFTKLIASKLGQDHFTAAHDPKILRAEAFIDYRVPITTEDLAVIAENWRYFQDPRQGRVFPSDDWLTPRHISYLMPTMKKISALLGDLRKDGVPVLVEDLNATNSGSAT